MTISRKAYPFLNWAGGKSRSVKTLLKYLPDEYGSYWEPFLGAGAVFFAISPRNSLISDINAELMNCYKYIRDVPEIVSKQLAYHKKKNSKDHYYMVRKKYNKSSPSPQQAARFIYLNKTCFNGIFRVNNEGKFNVPYGNKENPSFPTVSHIQSISEILSKAKIHEGSYKSILNKYKPKPGDFIYFDPPYPPLNGTSNFRHYTPDKFSIEDHKKVADVASLLSSSGCLVMISNADIQDVRSLYNEWYIHVLPVTRWVAANGTRLKVNELIITNYAVKEER